MFHPANPLQAAHARIAQLEQQIIAQQAQLQAQRQVQSQAAQALHEEKRRRADARLKVLYPLNRNGISTCAWHGTRNKPKKYPARQAPPGFLNCGCTEKDALFEEALARLGVSSLEANAERMHPDIRRALLRVLEGYYNYMDGDFDFDSNTSYWRNGQDPLSWKRKLDELSR
ncbi:hypothetical protein BKA62DRAFT_801909 [Auriculariales sp. MPI-PUGE-AT-0066]|nr:hypothetical protein BKA62DRAFT_801909 [Auriculariales sp. MPI-PUGE-AT-0066]